MLELHVYGPALGLPSINVNCLAAIYLLQGQLNSQQWQLIASDDATTSSFNELPALKVDDLWIAGYRNIARYLTTNQDTQLNASQDAKTEALLTFVEARGLPLLDLSLFISSDNYTNVTRPALSNILSWPQSWSVPSKLRKAAQARSQHLGLSALDVDAVREKESKKENEGLAMVIPKSLRVTKKSVTGLIGSRAEQTRFRLQAVTADFFEPLEQELGDKPYLTGNRSTVADWYALALFAQMLINDLPQPWLRQAFQKFEKLQHWTVRNMASLTDSQNLPVISTPTKSWQTLVINLVDTFARSMPLTLYTPALCDLGSRPRTESGENMLGQSFRGKHEYRVRQREQQLIVRGSIGMTLASVSLVGLMAYLGGLNLSWPSKRIQPQYHRFGDAGALLGFS